MTRHSRGRIILLSIVAGLVSTSIARAGDSMQAVAGKLYESLTDEQRQQAGLPFDTPERTSQVFTPGKRPGIQLKQLSDAQRTLADQLITAFTSDYGRQKALAIAAQDPGENGFGRYYLCFFGKPGDDRYAWRVAEHHLTLVQVEVGNGEATAFGPVLVGANPPTLWNDEEGKIIALFAALTPDERAKAALKKESMSSIDLVGGAGIPVAELNETARAKVTDLLDARMKFFSDDVRARFEKILAGRGGIDHLRIAFFGDADKPCSQGGKWDFKLGGKGFLCDYENTRGHIHMALRVNAPPPSK